MSGDNYVLSRREMLAVTGALTVPALTACGGGQIDDSAVNANDIPLSAEEIKMIEDFEKKSQTQATTGTSYTPAVPFSISKREVYQVEISHNKENSNETVVTLILQSAFLKNKQAIIQTVSRRTKNSTGIHALHFATLDTSPTFYVGTMSQVREAMGINVGFHNGTKWEAISIWGREKNDPKSAYFKHTQHNGEVEHEWLFTRSGVASQTNFDVAVRFFKIPDAEIGSVSPSWISNIVTNLSPLNHSGGKTIHKATAFDSSSASEYSRPAIEAGVIVNDQDPSVRDCIAVPGHRSGDHELLPVLTDVPLGNNARNYVKRRLERHMDKYVSQLKQLFPAAQVPISLAYNELTIFIYGKTKAAVYEWASKQTVEAVKTRKKPPNIFNSGLISKIKGVDNSTDGEAMLRKLQEAASAGEQNKYLGVYSAGIVIQGFVGGKYTGIFDLPSVAGFRFTVTVNKWTRVENGTGQPVVTSTYRCHPTDHYRVAFTVVVGTQDFTTAFGAAAQTPWIKKVLPNISGAIEVTVATRWKDGVCRVDGVGIDPVFDVDTGSWLGAMAQWLYKKLLPTALNLGTNLPSPPTLNLTGFQGIFGSIDQATLVGMGIAASKVGKLLALANAKTTKLAVFEANLGRGWFVNADTVIFGPTDPLRTGWQGPTYRMYAPGANYVAGFAWELPETFEPLTAYGRIISYVDAAWVDDTPGARQGFAIAQTP